MVSSHMTNFMKDGRRMKLSVKVSKVQVTSVHDQHDAINSSVVQSF